MNEVRRQASLSALGIQTWYARSPLPGAAPSPAFEWAQADEAPAGPLPLQAPQHLAPAEAEAPAEPVRDARSPRPSLAAVRASLAAESAAPGVSDKKAISADDALPDKNPENPLPPEDSPEPRSAQDVAVEDTDEAHSVALASHGLRLEGTFLSGRTLNLALDISQELSEAVQLKLAGNILRALGDQPVGQPQALCWPVFANAAVPGNDDRGLLRVVHSLLQEQPAKPWLVLGPQMQALFRELATESSQLFTLWLGNNASLQTLAANPASKKQLWQQLQSQLLAAPLNPGST